MKRRYKTYTQEDFGSMLGGIPQSRVSRILNGQEAVSWNMAAVLSKMFPGKGIEAWKNATGEDMTMLFEQLRLEAEVKAKGA